MATGIAILTAAQMRAVEQAAFASGVASAALMENAGAKVAEIARQGWAPRPTTVLCGPGNNGGDGFVAARLLAEAGWPVRVALVGDRAKLTGDARLMADLYEGEILPFAPAALEGAGLIIDALFGTGLTRALDGAALDAVRAANASPAPALGVDLPSGVNADTGAVMGEAIRAARTVTFFAKKPGHVLFPGRAWCGAVDVVDIGIDAKHADGVPVMTMENQPLVWGRYFRRPAPEMHKYSRGAVFVVSGGVANTGAARLAARAALRIGAGAVTLLSPPAAILPNAAHLTAIMLRAAEDGDAVAAAVTARPEYRNAGVVGPAAGVGAETRAKTLAALSANAGVVVDADALTSFADVPAALFDNLQGKDVLTPHPGEFARLFPDLAAHAGGKIAAAREAAARAGAVVVLKGADTAIAAPDGRVAINTNAPPELATAGSGDVLAGFVAGLLAQGAPAFEAACGGVWLHGACAQAFGPGLIAEDLPDILPAVLRSLSEPPQPAPGDGAAGASHP